MIPKNILEQYYTNIKAVTECHVYRNTNYVVQYIYITYTLHKHAKVNEYHHSLPAQSLSSYITIFSSRMERANNGTVSASKSSLACRLN